MRQFGFALFVAIAVVPLGAQETRFSKTMNAGDRLELANINGPIEVTQGTGRTAEIVVTKTVKRGDGNLVKAIMEESNGVVRVCTIYLNRDPERSTCRGNNSIEGDRLQVDMKYVVRAPSGVRVVAETVNGEVVLKGLDAPIEASTVNGGINVDGSSAGSLESVNGSIKARFTTASWSGTLKISTVNGGIDVTFPGSLSAEVRGSSVNGEIESDFPLTMEGRWGPKSARGTIGRGGRELNLETVNGAIRIRRN
jgi:DUF4097 and DUF4098 domain-containing protein YvlB